MYNILKIDRLLALLVLVISLVNGDTVQITGFTKINTQKKFNVIHNVDMEYYQFSKNSNQVNGLQYIIFEMLFDQTDFQNLVQALDILPILCYAYDKDPTISINGQQLDVTKCIGFNFNQFSRANGIYSLVIDTSNQSFNYISIGVFITGVQATYSITIKAQYDQMDALYCPFDCKNPYSIQASKGDCVNSVCSCVTGTIDEECSQNATYISSKPQKIQLDNKSMQYAYYRPDTPVKDLNSVQDITIQFSLLKKTPLVSMYLSIEGREPKKLVPTQDIYQSEFDIEDDSYSLTIKALGQYDETGQPRYSVFGFIIKSGNFPSNSNEIQISIIESSDDLTNTNMIIIYFLVGVVSLLFLIWIILTIIKIRYSRRNQVMDLAMAQAQMNAAQQRAQQRRGQSTKLNMEIIEQFLPQYTFEEIQKKIQDKGKVINDSCAVCLCEFEITDLCRETICNHYFHKDCLEQWLKKQENCPFCRTDLNRASLVKHFEQIKIQSDQGGDHNQDNQGQQLNNNLNVSNNNNLNEIQPSHQNRNEQSPLRNQSHQPSNANLIRLNERNQNQQSNLQPPSNNLLLPNNQIDRRSNQLNIVQRNTSNIDNSQLQSLQINNQSINISNPQVPIQNSSSQINNNQMEVHQLDLN